jgi:hypothetical protein
MKPSFAFLDELNSIPPVDISDLVDELLKRLFTK